MARGYDGLLRGMPEATMIVGLYRVGPAHARLVGRFLYRFERPSGFPSKVGPSIPSDEALAITLPKGTQLALLALAVEEDSGKGLQILYAALDPGDGVVAWTDHGPAPEPAHLYELCHGRPGAGQGHRVHLLLGDRDPSRGLPGDDWVDASLLWVSPEVQRREHRLTFVSADGRNDWTAVLELGLRGL